MTFYTSRPCKIVREPFGEGFKVAPGAFKTDGYQRNDNLMLSEAARADSIPGLEIKADDVRCTHGSTTGKVDEELIFYAQSRGFTRQEAARLIVTVSFNKSSIASPSKVLEKPSDMPSLARFGSTSSSLRFFGLRHMTQC